MIPSDELVDLVAVEIGADISYARFRDGDPGDVNYLTGIEIAILVGTGVLSSYLLGVVKGAAGKLGEKTGGLIADKIIDKLKQIRNRVDAANVQDSQAAMETAKSQQLELDNLIREMPPQLAASAAEPSSREEIIEISTYLVHWGFPDDKSVVVAERIASRIRTESSFGRR